MLSAFKSLRAPIASLAFAVSLGVLGCHAQTPQANSPQVATRLSPELARRVEVMIRGKSSLPPDYRIDIGPRMKSSIPGYDEILVTVSTASKASKPISFLLSTDNKTLAQLSTYDISKDPKELVSGTGRPGRGGPANAPVLIVGFDDLECPYCAKMHESIFPALTERYKDQVRVVYRDFPLDQHPWAIRAAINVNCVGAQSATGYWNLVDYIHLHAGELGGEEKSLAKANEMLDTLAREEGKRQNVNADLLNACIKKQDDTAIKASVKEGEELGVDSTPALFINGEKVEGAQPLEAIFRLIDDALIASGQTPPPPVQTPQTQPAAKPGN